MSDCEKVELLEWDYYKQIRTELLELDSQRKLELKKVAEDSGIQLDLRSLGVQDATQRNLSNSNSIIHGEHYLCLKKYVTGINLSDDKMAEEFRSEIDIKNAEKILGKVNGQMVHTFRVFLEQEKK